MSLQCGIVGLPNVGKSTLFNALTKAGIAAENYPFCTIEPNVGIVEVPDPRLAQISPRSSSRNVSSRRSSSSSISPAWSPAPRRRRPGQQVSRQHPRNRRHRQRRPLLRGRQRRPCLGPRRSALRHRNDPHRTGARRSRRRRAHAQPREQEGRAGDKEAQKLVGVLERLLPHLNEGNPARTLSLSADEKALLKPLCLLTIKPMMYVGNVLEDGFENNPHLDRLRSTPPQKARRWSPCAPRSKPNSATSTTRTSAFPRRPRPRRTGPESPGPRGLPVARPADLLHGRRQGSPRLDHPRRRYRPAGRRRHPHRLRARLHPRADDRPRRLPCLQGRTGRQGSRQDARRRQGLRRQGWRRAEFSVQRVFFGKGCSDE
jgi:hypothetical protein